MKNTKIYSAVALLLLVPAAGFLLLNGDSCGEITGFEDIDVTPVEVGYDENSSSVRVELENFGDKNVTVERLDIKLAHSDRESDVLMNGAKKDIRNGTSEVFYLNRLAEVTSSENCNSFEMEVKYDQERKVSFSGRGEVELRAEITG